MTLPAYPSLLPSLLQLIMTNKDAAKSVIVTVATFSICATAPWIVLVPVAAGAGLYIAKLFGKDEEDESSDGNKRNKPK